MSEQRIERFVNVYRSSLGDTYDSREGADHAAGLLRLRVAQCVEIRDVEPHPDKVREITDELQAQAIDAINRAEKVERQLKALTERAEKAEVAVRARDAEIEVLRAFLGQFEDGGMSGREVRETQNDAAAKFERWAAVRFHAVSLAQGDGDFSAIVEARKFRSHYFGAKEAKGDE